MPFVISLISNPVDDATTSPIVPQDWENMVPAPPNDPDDPDYVYGQATIKVDHKRKHSDVDHVMGPALKKANN